MARREHIPARLRHEVFQRDNYRCRECGATNKETTLEIDHIVPVSKGGTNNINNLQTLCKTCNRAKHARAWVGGRYHVKSEYQQYLSAEEQERIKLYNKLKSNLTDEQLELLYNHFPGDNDSRAAMVLYITKRFSENQINQILTRLEKEKEIFDKFYNSLTDNQLKLLHDEFLPLEFSKEEFAHFLSLYYAEDDIDQVFIKIHDKGQRKDFLFKKLCFTVDDDYFGTLSFFAPNEYETKSQILKYISNNYDEEAINYFISGDFNVIKAAKLRKMYASINQQFIDEGRIASIEEILNSANVNYKIINKDRLYGIYGYKEHLDKYKLKSGNYELLEPSEIRKIYASINQQFRDEGRIVSVEEIMDRANVDYKIINKGRLYKVYITDSQLKTYKFNSEQNTEIKTERNMEKPTNDNLIGFLKRVFGLQ